MQGIIVVFEESRGDSGIEGNARQTVIGILGEEDKIYQRQCQSGYCDRTGVEVILPELTISPHIVDWAGAAVVVDEAVSGAGAATDVDINAMEATSDRRILRERIAN